MGKREELPAVPHQDFYKKLRKRIHAWVQKKGEGYKFTEFLMLAPDLIYLLLMLIIDTRITTKAKSVLAIAIAYFISPVDLIPEAFLGAPGYADDVVVAVFALNMIINDENEQIIREHWPGERDILEAIKHILEVADEMIGSGAWEKIVQMFNSSETKDENDK